jgi:hypothetical protein
MLKAGKATSVKLRTMRVCSALPIVGIFALNPFFFWFLVFGCTKPPFFFLSLLHWKRMS